MTIAEWKSLRRWINWRRELVKGKATKVPKHPRGYNASATNPATWSTYADCAAVIAAFSGTGFVTGDGVVSVDLDDVIVDGKIISEAAAIVKLVDSYTEVSPSGTGLVIFALAELPANTSYETAAFTGELRSTGAFHTFTGNHLDGTPTDVLDRQQQINELHQRFAKPVVKRGDGIARPAAQEKFVRRFTAYAERLGAIVTDIRALGDGRVIVLTNPCLLYDDHDGGVGITADGVKCCQCFHTRCKTLGWAQWSKLVEQKYQRPMLLDGEIKWKK